MKDTLPPFTSEQIANAVAAGRAPRWDATLTPEQAVTHAAKYRDSQAHYQQHAAHSLADGDYRQAAEKSWGAFTQTVKAIAADRQVHLSGHISIMRVVGELSALAGQADADAAASLDQAIAAAHSLHTHFYENDLPDAVVIRSAGAVADAIALLQELFPPPSADLTETTL